MSSQSTSEKNLETPRRVTSDTKTKVWGVRETEQSSEGRSKRPLRALAHSPELAERFEVLRSIGRRVRSSEYHLTNACNIRCEGCWFFEYDFDKLSKEPSDLDTWRRFAATQANAGITSALLIGGEPTLFPDRISAFVEAMDFVTISSNGLEAFPKFGFENVAVALTLFGGAGLDDKMRAIKPNGIRFAGLFDSTLLNYKDDQRATFIYAIEPSATRAIDETVRKIADNGNLVSFNYYSSYGTNYSISRDGEERLLDEALLVADRYPESVVSHPYYIRSLITGQTEWGKFGYGSCPSISVDHPAHKERLKNGNPTLPGFNTYAADTKKIAFCCTSGHCETCRDSQAVHSWLMTNFRKFLRMERGLETWIEISESYWKQFVWSELHPNRATRST